MTPEGEKIVMPVDTLCVHGDSPAAVEILRAVRDALLKNGVQVVPIVQGSKGAGEQR